MRFIVELYRYVIFAVCGVTLIGLTLLVLAALDPQGPLSGWAGPALLIAAGALVFLILNIGAIAILLSLHDRHVALVEATQELSRSLDGMAATIAEASRGGYSK